jgi:hypothetical protein
MPALPATFHMHHRNTEGSEKRDFSKIREEILDAALERHRAFRPRLLASAYEHGLCHEVMLRRIAFERQKPLPVE